MKKYLGISSIIAILILNSLPSLADAASSNPSASKAPIVKVASAKDRYQDETAMITNLKMANKVLEAAIKTGQLTPKVYENAMKKITAINAKLAVDHKFHKIADLKPVLNKSDILLKKSITTNNKDIIAKRASGIKALTTLQKNLGIKSHVKTGAVTPEKKPPSKANEAQSSSIKTRYQGHTYNVKNQAEYDKVMQVIDANAGRLDDYQLGTERSDGTYSPESIKAFKDYLNGARSTGGNATRGDRNASPYEASLQALDISIWDLVKAGVSRAQVEKVYKASQLAMDIIGEANTTDPRDGSPSSAYDTLFNKVADCDSDSQVASAMFDRLGFTSAVIKVSPTHAEPAVKLNGQWFIFSAGSFIQVSLDNVKFL